MSGLESGPQEQILNHELQGSLLLLLLKNNKKQQQQQPNYKKQINVIYIFIFDILSHGLGRGWRLQFKGDITLNLP
jgi:hypothetical protein